MGSCFQSVTLAEGQSVQDHPKSMKEISDKLAALGSAVAEEEKVVSLLLSVFHVVMTCFVIALEAKGDDLTLVFVQQALVNEEQKRQATNGGAATGNSHD